MGTPIDPKSLPSEEDTVQQHSWTLPSVNVVESHSIEQEVEQNIWEGFSCYPFYSASFPNFRGNWRSEGASYEIGEHGVDLLHRLLEVNPVKRISAKDALNHRYFDDLAVEEKVIY